MKNVSRSKLFICFRPVVLDEDDHHHPLEMDPKLGRSNRAFVSIQNKGSNIIVKSPSSTPTLEVEEETSTSSSSSTSTSTTGIIIPTRCNQLYPLMSPASSKKNLSRVMKAVFFETILTRRIRDRRSLERESDRSSRGASSSSSSSSSSRRWRKPPRAGQLGEPIILVEELTSPETDPPSRSVSAPELRILADQHQVSTPRKKLLHQNQNDNNNNNNNYKKPKPEGNYNTSMLYMLLLATLVVTVVWGKLCAILFTSIWMYFMPRRGAAGSGSCSRRKEHGAARRGESTGEYSNKRVVMEGILGRNHHHQRQR